MFRFIGKFRRRLSSQKIQEYLKQLENDPNNQRLRRLLSGRRNETIEDRKREDFKDVIKRHLERGRVFNEQSQLSPEFDYYGGDEFYPLSIHDGNHGSFSPKGISKFLGNNSNRLDLLKRRGLTDADLDYLESFMRDNDDLSLNHNIEIPDRDSIEDTEYEQYYYDMYEEDRDHLPRPALVEALNLAIEDFIQSAQGSQNKRRARSRNLPEELAAITAYKKKAQQLEPEPSKAKMLKAIGESFGNIADNDRQLTFDLMSFDDLYNFIYKRPRRN